MVMLGVGAWGGDFSFMHSCARIAEICAVHNAVRPMTRTGGDERTARRADAGAFHVRTGFESFGVDGGSFDFLVRKFLRRGTVGRRGGKDEQRRQMTLLKFQKGRARATGRRHTLAVLLSG